MSRHERRAMIDRGHHELSRRELLDISGRQLLQPRPG